MASRDEGMGAVLVYYIYTRYSSPPFLTHGEYIPIILIDD